jgi:hypothetical protein
MPVERYLAELTLTFDVSDDVFLTFGGSGSFRTQNNFYASKG